jgi:hypothetical protein
MKQMPNQRSHCRNTFATLLVLLGLWPLPDLCGAALTNSPYPPSTLIKGITWHWETYRTAAPGSDLWPITWGADDNLYAAWGDGGGFGGTDHDGRVALGFARIAGMPEHFTGTNLNGGKNPQHPASFAKQGKVGGILAIGSTLYGWLNMQNGKWPDVDKALVWSDDLATSWKQSQWVFPKGQGNFKPGTFVNFGGGYSGLPPEVAAYVYFYGQRQGMDGQVLLGRVGTNQLSSRPAYEFLSGLENERPVWSTDSSQAHEVFSDRRLVGDLPTVVYVAPLKRYLLAIFHQGPGQLGIFEAPQPWGPWTTVAYYEHWGNMGTEDHGLTCSFPAKWVSADGLTLWCVFSVYGEGAKQGLNAHDKFNLVRATLELNH